MEDFEGGGERMVNDGRWSELSLSRTWKIFIRTIRRVEFSFTYIFLDIDIDVRAIRLEEFHSRDVSELRNGILAFRNR